MYIVTIENNGIETEIHGATEKLDSGKIVKGINSIDAFSFTILPSNVGFDQLNEFTTLVKVYNTIRKRYEFYGRVLLANPSMDEDGLISKDVTCESYLGYLCDSQQQYVEEKNWTVTGLLEHIVSVHNSQLEEHKRFKIGTVNVTDPNDNLFVGIQRENTWNTIMEKLVDVLGGEIRFRVEGDGLYLDYLTEVGETKQTAIELSKNMKSISKEHNPAEYVTRLIPLGCKLEDSEDRLDITSVNGGLNYIDDAQAIKLYGIHIRYKEWDNVTKAENLLSKAKAWLAENNRMLVKYYITALDLSLIGLDIDDFDVCNKHPIRNRLLGIDDVARIIKKNIDICNETESTIEIGDVFKNLSDLDVERDKKIKEASESISKVASSSRAGQSKVENELKQTEIKMTELGYLLTSAMVDIDGANAQIALKANAEEVELLKRDVTSAEIRLDGLEANILLKANQTTVDGLNQRMTNAEIQIDGANAQIALKANQATVDAMGERVNSAEIVLDGLNGEITLKADKVYVDSEITAVKTLVANEIDAAIADVNLSIGETVVTNYLTVTGRATLSSLALGGSNVAKTTVPVVTSFTQALGESSPTQDITLLTCA